MSRKIFESFDDFLLKSKNDVIVATDETIRDIVKQEVKRLGNNADLNHIDTSKVTLMHALFKKSAPKFNGDISKWEVSNVTHFDLMFQGCAFNGDISNWNVSNAKNMMYMFHDSKFKGNLEKWKPVNVTNMINMFKDSPLEKNLPKWYKDVKLSETNINNLNESKSELVVTGNESDYTFTIEVIERNKPTIVYKTNPVSKIEFEELEYNTENDWKNFLRTSNDYYVVK